MSLILMEQYCLLICFSKKGLSDYNPQGQTFKSPNLQWVENQSEDMSVEHKR